MLAKYSVYMVRETCEAIIKYADEAEKVHYEEEIKKCMSRFWPFNCKTVEEAKRCIADDWSYHTKFFFAKSKAESMLNAIRLLDTQTHTVDLDDVEASDPLRWRKILGLHKPIFAPKPKEEIL